MEHFITWNGQQLVWGAELARRLNLSRQRITKMRQGGKIRYAVELLQLYDFQQAVIDYDRNSDPGHVLRHKADKLDAIDRHSQKFSQTAYKVPT
ncbi:hypothetical protein [Methylomonas rapida]|uniref:Helix-turn-helix domain-containing protein n=1 Tax=Methylomonas rapida TaxID=2963939 RepID=A0ABY7GF22_9GAMM|nr:hypothetical protein [Methylomonas rapida]WAR43887.1 hypothetical protein NM686_016130 [Methylomonas rapida]